MAAHCVDLGLEWGIQSYQPSSGEKPSSGRRHTSDRKPTSGRKHTADRKPTLGRSIGNIYFRSKETCVR